MSDPKRTMPGSGGEPYYERSYKVSPDEGEKFSKEEVEAVMKVIIEKELKGKKYSEKTALQYSRIVTKLILETVRDSQKYPRYKFIVQVSIGERDGHGMRVTSRCLWYPKEDNYAKVVFENQSLVCIAICFGIFYE